MARRRKGLAVHGWVNLDKPLDLTSTDAVSRVRRLFNAQKAGHAGTLDPLASGVLPIALGEATKTVPYLMDAEKAYRFTIAWGATTASFDREGAVVATSQVRPTPDEVAAVLPRFVGEIDQAPPAFSAVRVEGQRAYDLAREGVAFDLQDRRVTIHAAAVVQTPDPDHVTLEISCGKGVYVRALVRDIAAALGACGHVSSLRRTRVGVFSDTEAIGLDKLAEIVHRGALLEALLPVETALDDIPALAVTDEDAFRLKQGRAIVLLPRQTEALSDRLVSGSRIVSAMQGEKLVALGEVRAGRLSPVRVFNLDQET